MWTDKCLVHGDSPVPGIRWIGDACMGSGFGGGVDGGACTGPATGSGSVDTGARGQGNSAKP